MADLSGKYWNERERNVVTKARALRETLTKALKASGYVPGTEPPEPEVRWAIYVSRPPEMWNIMARTDPKDALEQIQDFANMARRRGLSEAALDAARAVLAETGVQEER